MSSPAMRALVLDKAQGAPGQVWHPIHVKSLPKPQPAQGQVLIQLKAAALNHREIFIRQSLYPGITFPSILGADGAGILISPSTHALYNKPVLLSPMTGWTSQPSGPEDSTAFAILGGTKGTEGRGTFAEFIVADEKDVVPAPAFLFEGKEDWESAAALPLGGLTAFRALFTKGQLQKGQNVLITGIGGGVALQALQFAVAAGAKVFVTSGSPDKLDKAKSLGAVDGASYKDDDWGKQLLQKLPKDRPYLDVIIDSGGGDLLQQTMKALKVGGIVVNYGSTTLEPLTFTISETLKNVDLKGSTMGSLEEFKDMVHFVQEHKIVPVVDTVLNGLEEAEKGFELLKKGGQMGKIVMKIEEQKSKL